MADPTMPVKTMASVTEKALEWVATTSSSEIIQVREAQMQKIEQCAAELRESGDCKRWLESCDEGAKKIVREVNGPLLELLLGDLNYHDVACVELFRTGRFSFGASNAVHLYLK
jgi:hypothetical protein